MKVSHALKSHAASALALLALATPGAAQHDRHDHQSPGGHSPYADQEVSGISSLSPQELADLLDGAGMGMARPAELHQYPGPKHVLELAAELALTEDQQSRIEAIRASMLEDARSLGEKIVERERTLDLRFAHRHVDEATLRRDTSEIAALYGELRFAHLRAHLETRALLSASQIERYDELRGYGG